MTKARSSIVSVSDTPYYHCTSRCVRRAYLCGEDHYTRKSFEHRREWFIERLAQLSKSFCIDVCAYAVMSNHCHLVLYVDAEALQALSSDEIIERWCLLYRGPLVIQKYRRGESLDEFERFSVSKIVEVWRGRLGNLSWYMRCLNEYIARRANREDGCTGRFWEGRFKSQALLDEQALITAMAYVDLNPIRSKIAKDLPTSDKTSVQQRLRAASKGPRAVSVPIRDFVGTRGNGKHGLPFKLQDYLKLVDWSGRCVREDKRGALNTSSPPILRQLGIVIEEWLPTVTMMQARYEMVMGSPDKMKAHAESRGGLFYRGYRQAQRFYRQPLA